MAGRSIGERFRSSAESSVRTRETRGAPPDPNAQGKTEEQLEQERMQLERARLQRERWILKNQIPQRIEIGSRAGGDSAVLQIPPYGQQERTGLELEDFDLKPWTSRGIIEKRAEEDSPETIGTVLVAPFAVGLYAGLLWLLWYPFRFLNDAWVPPDRYWPVAGVLAVLGVVGAGLWAMYVNGSIGILWQSLGHRTSAAVQVLVAFGLPGVVLFSPELLAWFKTGKGLVAPDSLHLIGRGLQLIFAGTLSAWPALLFYLFDRQKLSTLREGFFRSIVLLDRELRTLHDARSVYGARADEILGRDPAENDSTRLAHTKRTIISWATITITLGWIFTLAPAGLVVQDDLMAYFVPTPIPLVYAFLGAYVFTAWLLARRYVRSDLKPSAYAHINVRVVTAILITWAFSVLLGAPLAEVGDELPTDPSTSASAMLVIGFIIGFFPETGLNAIFEFVRNRSWVKANIPSLEEKFPLERLDGINIYHRARLIDEGIENMENLAHADLVELMLETRIPLATLVDWIDQSILYLHLGSADGPESAAFRRKLRSYGVRTATDLVASEREAKARGPESHHAFLAILDDEKGPDAMRVSKLRVILDSLADDEWMRNLERWREPQRYEREILKVADLKTWDSWQSQDDEASPAQQEP